MSQARFYPIFDSCDWIRRMLPLGIGQVQLRIKNEPQAILRDQIRTARALCLASDAQLIVNDHWQLAIEESCDFVHLGQEDLDGADLPALRRKGIRVGISTHDEDERERALGLEPAYIALGPIYPTRLKAMRFGPQGLERIAEWRRHADGVPLVAIGGLTVERAPGVFAAGADVVSVVTDITLHPDPEARVREWLEVTS